MKLVQPPLNRFDLKALGDVGATIARERERSGGAEIDWSSCGLAARYGMPGDPGHDREERRRKLLAA